MRDTIQPTIFTFTTRMKANQVLEPTASPFQCLPMRRFVRVARP